MWLLASISHDFTITPQKPLLCFLSQKVKNNLFEKIPSLRLEKSTNIYEPQSTFVIELREQLDSTTMQSQLFMEGVEFILDVLGTGAVLPCTEIQQDVDLQETNTTIMLEEQRVQKGIQKNCFRKQEGWGEWGRNKQTVTQACEKWIKQVSIQRG